MVLFCVCTSNTVLYQDEEEDFRDVMYNARHQNGNSTHTPSNGSSTHAYAHTCVYVHSCIHSRHAHTRAHVHTRTRGHVHIRAHADMRTYAHTRTCAHAHTQTRRTRHTLTHVHTRTRTHTHIRIYAPKQNTFARPLLLRTTLSGLVSESLPWATLASASVFALIASMTCAAGARRPPGVSTHAPLASSTKSSTPSARFAFCAARADISRPASSTIL